MPKGLLPKVVKTDGARWVKEVENCPEKLKYWWVRGDTKKGNYMFGLDSAYQELQQRNSKVR